MHGRSTPDVQVDIFDIGEIAYAVWRRRYWIFLTLVGGAIIGALFSLSIPDQYESSARIEIEEAPIPTSTNPLSTIFSSQGTAATQIAIIDSNSIKSAAIAQAGFETQVYATRGQRLRNVYNRVRNRERLWQPRTLDAMPPLEIVAFKAPERWLDEAFRLQILESDRFRLILPDGREVESTFNDVIALGEQLELQLNKGSGRPGEEYSIRVSSPPEAMDSFTDNLTVQEIGKSGILSISFLDSSPNQALTALKALLTEFISADTKHAVETAQKRLDYIESEIPAAIGMIEEAEEALNKFQKDAQTVNIQFEAESLLRQVAQIELLLRENQIPKEKDRLESIRAELFDRLGKIPDSQQHILNLTRDIEIAQTIYLELMKRVQELRVARASARGLVRIIDEPYAYAKPTGPGRGRLTVLIALAAVTVHVMVLFVRLLKPVPRSSV